MLARVGTPSSPVRERKKEREREREREKEREREREKEREYLFLKGLTGALAPFSYLCKLNEMSLDDKTLYKMPLNITS
jgi:hypothetical protein